MQLAHDFNDNVEIINYTFVIYAIEQLKKCL